MSSPPQGQFENLTYWASRECVVGIATPRAWLYVCHLFFHSRDGSIFVQFPYFRERDGIATVVRLEADGSRRRTIRFVEEGKVASHLVKYAHHPDGRVHFSQDGRVRTEIKRQSQFPLNGPIGKLFELNAVHPAEGFQPLDDAKMKKGRPHLLFRYRRAPGAVRIRGSWRRKTDVASWARPEGAAIGPRARVQSVVDGTKSSVFFVGQPAGHPLQDHVLAIMCDRVAVPAGADRSMLLFFGGADSDEVARSGDAAAPSEYLAAMYPVHDRLELERLIGSIDYRPTE